MFHIIYNLFPPGDAAGDSAGHNRTTPLNSFLPPDLLSEGM